MSRRDLSRLRWALAGGTVALFAFRLLISAMRDGPVLVADEVGYLTNARTIVGGVAGQLELAPFYRGGYSLLIAPLVELGSDPSLAYHLVLALNAALAAAVLPLLYLLLVRFAAVPPWAAFWIALAGALYPAITVLSQVALSENALFPLVCVWLLAFGALFESASDSGRLRCAVAVGAATGALWAVHNRMIVAVVLTLAVLVWMLARRRLRPGAFLAALALVAVAVLGTHLLDDFLIARSYGDEASDELSSRLDQLWGFGGPRTALANLLGQAWYLLVATFGLVAATAFGYLRGRREPGDAGGRLAPPVVGLLLGLSALLLLISAVAFPERTRPDMLIYGRYTEIAAPALVAFGLVALLRVGRRPSLGPAAIGLVLLTGVVALIRATASDPDPVNRWNVSALPFLTFQLGPPVLLAAALLAATGGWLLLRAAGRSPRALGILAAALFVAVTAYGAWNPVRSTQRAVYPGGWSSPEAAAAAAGGGSIAYDLDRYDVIGLYVPQWFLPNTRLVLFHGDTEPPPAALVISDSAWGPEQGAAAEKIWEDAGRDQVLWNLDPACRDDC